MSVGLTVLPAASPILFLERREHAKFMMSGDMKEALRATRASLDTCHCCVRPVLLSVAIKAKFAKLKHQGSILKEKLFIVSGCGCVPRACIGVNACAFVCVSVCVCVCE